MAQQIVTAAQWDSNKTTLFRVIFKEYHLDCPKALNVQIEVYYKIDILLNNFLTMYVVHTVRGPSINLPHSNFVVPQNVVV